MVKPTVKVASAGRSHSLVACTAPVSADELFTKKNPKDVNM